MDRKSKRLVTLGLLLAFTVALPLFVWGIITQRFELREKASVAPTCQPRPDCLDATPHPCQIPEPEEGWCPAATTSPTATSDATSSPTSSPQNTATGAPIGGPQGEPNSCGGTCGSKYNCGANLFCYQGFCRNPICPTDTDCACSTPSPTPKPTATPKKTIKPTPTMEIVYVSPNPSVSPSPLPTPTPTDSSGVNSGSPEVAGTNPNLNFLLYIAAGSFISAIILFIINLMKTKRGFAPLALILVVALPVFVWAVATGNFNINKRAASGEPTPTAIPTPTAPGYYLIQYPSSTIDTWVHDQSTGYGIAARLYLNGLTVDDQTGYRYIWTVANPAIAKINPWDGSCIYAPKSTPPCPNTHLTIKALKRGSTTIKVVVFNASSVKIASVVFILNVSEFPPTATPKPTPRPVQTILPPPIKVD